MIQYHPDHNILTEYVAGSLPSAQAIAVKAHLDFCPHCRHDVRRLEALGGSLLDNLEPEQVSDSLWQGLMANINMPSADSHPEPVPTRQSDRELPTVLQRLLAKQQTLKWKKLGPSLESVNLKTGQQMHQVSLHRIFAGGKTIEHNHKGDEITVVMKGSFSDEEGLYQPGDFIYKQAGDIHKPQASQHEDCLCLVVQTAPIALTGFFSRWLNPLLRISPG